MKEIPLTQGQVALIDDEDYLRVSQYKWCVRRVETKHLGNKYYVAARVKGKATMLHRFILRLPSAKFGKGRVVVDHVDGNPLNNTRANLRICTDQLNAANRPKTYGLSKYKGVSRELTTGRWKSTLGQAYLGTFFTQEAAALAYNRAALALYGEFAHLNVLPFTEAEIEAMEPGEEERRKLNGFKPGLKGTSYKAKRTSYKKWRATLGNKTLGYFETAEEAHAAYLVAKEAPQAEEKRRPEAA